MTSGNGIWRGFLSGILEDGAAADTNKGDFTRLFRS